jgi:hypothetical protein
MHRLKCTIFDLRSVVCALLFCISACNVPNVESPDLDPDCSAARLTVKKAYALAIYGNADYPEPSNATWNTGAFLTTELIAIKNNSANRYYLYGGEKSQPSRYEVQECTLRTLDKITVRFTLYFESNGGITTKDLFAEVIKTGEVWKINSIAAQ